MIEGGSTGTIYTNYEVSPPKIQYKSDWIIKSCGYCTADGTSVTGIGTNYYDTNTAALNKFLAYYNTSCVSSYNVQNLVGGVWKYTKDIFELSPSATSVTWEIPYGTHDEDLDIFENNLVPREYMGNPTIPAENAMKVLLVGGSFNSSTHAGCRAAKVDQSIYEADSISDPIGVWLVCDSI